MKNLLESINVFITNKPLITILLAAIIMDVTCGVLRAAKQKVLNSTIGFYVIIVSVVKSLIKSRVLVLLQNIKAQRNLCVV